MKTRIFTGILLCLFMQLSLFANTQGLSMKFPGVETNEEDNNDFEEKTLMLTNESITQEFKTENPKWVVYYGHQAHVSNFYGYDPIVFYPQKHPLLAPLIVTGKTLLSFLSLADVHSDDFFYKELKNQKLLLGDNPLDTSRSLIDIRNPKWEELLLGSIIPEILAEGFNGICVANINAVVNLELHNPIDYAGMTETALKLLTKIRESYPEYTLMIDMHGLLHVGEKFIPLADMITYEHLFTRKEGSKLVLRGAQEYKIAAERLQGLAAKKEGLKVYTVDFWPEKEKNVIKNIYAQQRAHKFIPYVATDGLFKLSKEPE